MLDTNNNLQVYLAPGATDMRKSIDGLAIWVSEMMELDPCSSSLFVFCNRARDKLKILHWDRNGFWLYYRRLEKGRFQWPKENVDKNAISMTRRELNWLLDGLSLEQQKAHKNISLKCVA
ncbi:MAG: IS66 family insertion sequence element accessory protein TnpB [Pseudomonadales bacterium]|nr:IS66 family insertion sequence element accessory protein TnpB [Pseudomonadales bacterium]